MLPLVSRGEPGDAGAGVLVLTKEILMELPRTPPPPPPPFSLRGQYRKYSESEDCGFIRASATGLCCVARKYFSCALLPRTGADTISQNKLTSNCPI